MTLEEALAYIHRVDWRGSVPGLERIDALLGKLGHPERSVKYIHVTGTNGKGSTCAMLASVLHAAGYTTGLYTSPYIFRFNERMQINGTAIPDEDLCALVEELRPLADSMENHPTEFELVTAIGLTWFARQGCDVVVCEVGMGGQKDATNVIPPPEAAVITNIGLDHTIYLGDTVEKIAATKAGIIKRGCSAVLYPCAPSVRAVIESRCREVGAPVEVADFGKLRPVSDSLEGQIFDFGELHGLHLPLLGGHQLYNAAVALTVIETLRRRGWRIPQEAVAQGLAAVSWPGRFQVVRREPLVILDGGHNPQCMASLAGALEEYLHGREITVLTGVLADKDFREMYDAIAPLASRFVTVTPDNPRALAAEELSAFLERYGKPVTACATIAQGVQLAVAETPPEGAAVCCGSLYLLGDVAQELERV